MTLLFANDYRENPVLRKSLSRLAESVFGISFEEWYEKGYWTDKYNPYSFIAGDKVVSNVSVNKIGLIVEGKYRKGLQIGTVMTHPDYRGQGLSRLLMERVLREFKGKYDLMYLFANDSVLGYYPKFGFNETRETVFSTFFAGGGAGDSSVRRLDMDNGGDRELLYHFAKKRIPVSRTFATTETAELLMFYCLSVFRERIFYLEDENCIVIYGEKGEEMEIYDILTMAKVDMSSVLSKIPRTGAIKIIFHFTPGQIGHQVACSPIIKSETLFVRYGNDFALPEQFKHPLTSQA
ncbi:GNAT family N-acetyltransferase [Neobacillus notoginsengisoli]|uniref:GNAT family N-acetyltransferase n=1 Tax=Neobacillus notoginsengisoli TaxID=1578198 RepID=A0A417YPF3_9BACI|nr:GNAT family N-acetyltransferase [Neobacillus notoginsengisoli]RHW35675.1 GNAT family N-acetyltransferase [Neobacillus notoginsengisoli]